jgi:hypothetical protein
MADAVFDAGGSVGSSGNRRIANAWSGSGSEIANLLGSANVQALPSLLSETTTTTTTTAPKYSYPESKVKKDYSAAYYSQPKASLFSGDTQSVLQQYINAINNGYLDSVPNRSAVDEALEQYRTIQRAAQAQQDERNLNTLRNAVNGTGNSGMNQTLNAYNSLTVSAGPAEMRSFVNQASHAEIDQNSLLAMDALNRSWQKKGYI